MRTQTSRIFPSSATSVSTRVMLKTSLLAALLLNGCAVSSGVQSYGARTYRVEGASEFGLSQAKERAFQDASAYCSSSGERIQEISSSTGAYWDAFGDPLQTFELIFQCASESKYTIVDTAAEIFQ